MTRRELLGYMAATRALSWGMASAPVANRSAPLNDASSATKYLLLDSRLIDHAANAELVIGKVDKYSHNPLPFLAHQDQGVPFYCGYPNVYFDDEEKTYKSWYGFISKSFVKWDGQRWIEQNGEEVSLCYATSKDGVLWERPSLGLVEYRGSKDNNFLWRGPAGTGVRKDTRDLDSAGRYKMFFQDVRASGNHLISAKLSVAFSRDGLRWSEPVSCPEIESPGDTHNNFFWDERLGRYVGFVRLKDKAFAYERLVGRCESDDFRHWTKAVEVLRGDEVHQTYAMPVFPYANVYLGLVMVLNTETDFVDCELAWSPDTLHWERVCPGSALIARGCEGSFDHGMVFAAACPILRDGDLKLYYSGTLESHSEAMDGVFCLARLRVDGFAGFEPTHSDEVSTIVTKSVTCSGSQLQVSADAARGELRVGVVGHNKLSTARCLPITENVTDHVIGWAGSQSLAEVKGKQIQLLFEFKSATVYAFAFTDYSMSWEHEL